MKSDSWSESGLRRFARIAKETNRDGERVYRLIFQQQTERAARLKAAMKPWNQLYELPLVMQVAAHLTLLGAVETVKEALSNSDPLSCLADWAEASENAEVEDFFGVSDLDDADINAVAAFCSVGFSLVKTVTCLGIHGRTINALVADAREGDVDALELAASIDLTVLGCPSVQHTLALLVAKGDHKRRKRIFKSPHKKLLINRDTRLTHAALNDADHEYFWRLSERERERLFVDVMSVYPSDGASPAKALSALVRSWNK